MSATNKLAEILTRHQIFLQRYAAGKVKDLNPIIENLRKIIIKELSLFDLADLILLDSIISQLEEILILESSSVVDFINLTTEEIGVYESGFYNKALSGVVSVSVQAPTNALIIGAATTKPMRLISGGSIKRLTISEAAKEFSKGMAKEVANTLRTGIVNGLTQQQITKMVSDTVKTRSRKQAATLTRTVINHVTAQARQVINTEVFGDYEDLFIATLDSNTTITCAGFDDQSFKQGEGPRPPLHYGCRSLRVAKIPPELALPGFEGVRPTVVDGQASQVSAKTTYSGFLKAQSKEFQDEVLGVERAKLFRSGEVTLDKFTDDDGRVLTLDELRQRESLTF